MLFPVSTHFPGQHPFSFFLIGEILLNIIILPQENAFATVLAAITA